MKSPFYRSLRRARVAIAVVYAGLLTASIAVAAFSDTALALWLRSMQLVPAILAGAASWIVLWVVLTLTFGRVYCSALCPLGTAMDCASRLHFITAGRGPRPWRYRYAPPLLSLRVPIPIIVGLCLMAGFTAAVELTDPFALYARAVQAVCRPLAVGLGSILAALIIITVVAAVAWSRGRWLCNTVCPAGSLLGFLGRAPIYRVDINTDLCTHCGRCEAVCKSQCIRLPDCTVDMSRCVMCLDCAAECPAQAISVRRGRHTLSTPLMQPAQMKCAEPAKPNSNTLS